MQIVRDLAGYSYGRSDLVRRAMAKKKHDVMAKEREYFINGIVEEDGTVSVPGCVRNGVDAQTATKIFDEMTAFASYAFNKSHAAAYGVVAVQTAYLKLHYPVEFFAAMLNSVSGNASKISLYVQYCRKHDIPILPPDVNESVRKFSVGKDYRGKRGIRFGLGAIKGCGEKALEDIITERKARGPFKDVFDFCRRVTSEQMNKRVLEGLIKAGAFDQTGATRAQLIAVYESALEGAVRERRTNIAGQMSLFGEGLLEEKAPPLPQVGEYPLRMVLAMEKEFTGVYISGHPLDEYAGALSGLTMNTSVINEALEAPDKGLSWDGTNVRMGGMLVDVRQKATKKGDMMAFAILEDMTGQIEALIFPSVYERFGPQLMQDTAVVLSGRLSLREDEDPKLLLESVAPLMTDAELARAVKNAPPERREGSAPKAAAPQDSRKLYLKIPSRVEMQPLSHVLQEYPGHVEVRFFVADERITLVAPEQLRCDASQGLLQRLRGKLGDAAVVVK